jgi:hypothetical protein
MKALMPKEEGVAMTEEKDTTRPEGENRDPEHEIPDPSEIKVDVPFTEGKDPEFEMPDPDNTKEGYQDPMKDPEQEMPDPDANK